MRQHRVRYLTVSVGLGLFLAVSYLACTIWDGLRPSQAVHGAWVALLPGFTWWSWGSFFLGLVEVFAYGFWLALVVPITDWTQRRLAFPGSPPERRSRLRSPRDAGRELVEAP